MTFLCNTKIRPLQPEITYTFMETIYLCIIIFLFVLAVFDLMVGVSNDAVNFLNSEAELFADFGHLFFCNAKNMSYFCFIFVLICNKILRIPFSGNSYM